jgi:hypothetical protein
MSEPGSMSLTATLVLTAVVLVAVGLWLAAVFRAGHSPAGAGGSHNDDPGHGTES